MKKDGQNTSILTGPTVSKQVSRKEVRMSSRASSSGDSAAVDCDGRALKWVGINQTQNCKSGTTSSTTSGVTSVGASGNRNARSLCAVPHAI